jgi:hypothetical protein
LWALILWISAKINLTLFYVKKAVVSALFGCCLPDSVPILRRWRAGKRGDPCDEFKGRTIILLDFQTSLESFLGLFPFLLAVVL